MPTSVTVAWESVFEELPDDLAIPDSIFSHAIEQNLRGQKVTLGGEILYRVQGGNSRFTLLEQFNTYLRFGMFQGLRYYSSRDKKMQTLIYESYRVSDPDDHTPLPDLELSEPVSQVSLFVRQRMRDFGWVVWKVDYLHHDGKFYIHTENARPVYIGPVRIIDTGEYSVILLSIPENEDLLMYQIGLVHSTGIEILKSIGFGESLEDSLYYRLRAMGTLFSEAL